MAASRVAPGCPAQRIPSPTVGGLPSLSTFLVRSLASCTLGWSNTLIPRIAPATAIAYSQRKNSAPRLRGSLSFSVTPGPARVGDAGHRHALLPGGGPLDAPLQVGGGVG